MLNQSLFIFKLSNHSRYLQETIKKQIAILYLWPNTLEIPVLDAST